MYHSAVRLVLASASPRRAELLARAGFEFDVVPANVDERLLDGEDPHQYVARLAHAKVAAIQPSFPDRVVVGADTTVLIDDEVWGKPEDTAAAAMMLRQLSGRTHRVLTGVEVGRGTQVAAGREVTKVTLVELSDVQIASYIASGEPMDKAGGYAAQGIASRFIKRIEGSYANVVGLPLALLDRLLKQFDEENGVESVN